jgi:hypothetical protein
VEGGLREGSKCGLTLPFERDVGGGHVLLEECGKGGREIGIVGYECKEGVGVVLIGGSGNTLERRGGYMVGQRGWMGVDDSDGARIKSSGGVVSIRRGGGFVSAGGICGVVHGGGDCKGGAEEVVEWECCCYGGNERSGDENIGSPV